MFAFRAAAGLLEGAMNHLQGLRGKKPDDDEEGKGGIEQRFIQAKHALKQLFWAPIESTIVPGWGGWATKHHTL